MSGPRAFGVCCPATDRRAVPLSRSVSTAPSSQFSSLSLLVVLLNVFAPSLLVILALFLSVLPLFLCLSAVGVLTMVFSPDCVGFHTASSGEARVSERASRKEGGCCLSLSFSFSGSSRGMACALQIRQPRFLQSNSIQVTGLI